MKLSLGNIELYPHKPKENQNTKSYTKAASQNKSMTSALKPNCDV